MKELHRTRSLRGGPRLHALGPGRPLSPIKEKEKGGERECVCGASPESCAASAAAQPRSPAPPRLRPAAPHPEPEKEPEEEPEKEPEEARWTDEKLRAMREALPRLGRSFVDRLEKERQRREAESPAMSEEEFVMAEELAKKQVPKEEWKDEVEDAYEEGIERTWQDIAQGEHHITFDKLSKYLQSVHGGDSSEAAATATEAFESAGLDPANRMSFREFQASF